MEEQNERPYEPSPQSSGEPDDSGADLASRQASMSAMLAMGDEIIKNSLSGDSEEFLRANRQQGGQ